MQIRVVSAWEQGNALLQAGNGMGERCLPLLGKGMIETGPHSGTNQEHFAVLQPMSVFSDLIMSIVFLKCSFQ